MNNSYSKTKDDTILDTSTHNLIFKILFKPIFQSIYSWNSWKFYPMQMVFYNEFVAITHEYFWMVLIGIQWN